MGITDYLRRPISITRHLLRGLSIRKAARDDLHKYWIAPDDGSNRPQEYLNERCNHRSEFLVDLVRKYGDANARILEIGCNAGRNLSYLYRNGYRNVEAIEISETAIALLQETFPEMAKSMTIYNRPVEDAITSMGSSDYNIVFTVAVLEHIHRDSEWVFEHMARITKDVLITFEDERCASERHFPRNYRSVFEKLGMEQVFSTRPDIKNSGFVARVFRRKHFPSDKG